LSETEVAGLAPHGGDPFAERRPMLLGLAYRILGSFSDAEDVVQEAWVRWSRADRSAIERPAAWLTTVTTRLALDRIRVVKRRRETYVGPWLPEPVTTEPGPEDRVELADSLKLGFLVVLDKLGPTERAVFILADVFAVPYAEISGVVGKSEGACRQIASRARRKVRSEVPTDRSVADLDLLSKLTKAFASGEVDRVVELLDPDVVLISDSGPDRRAARRVVRGADRVARLAIYQARRLGTPPMSTMIVNGSPSIALEPPEGLMVVQGEHRHGRIVVVRILMNPDKMAGIQGPVHLR
jgi:RNA polymerase sigma-70 factor (ECF subfamily)